MRQIWAKDRSEKAKRYWFMLWISNVVPQMAQVAGVCSKLDCHDSWHRIMLLPTTPTLYCAFSFQELDLEHA